LKGKCGIVGLVLVLLGADVIVLNIVQKWLIFCPLSVENINSPLSAQSRHLANFVSEPGGTSMKYTQNTLDKIERILDEVEYVVRYERGNFQSGYCILESKRVVVLNKFLQMEGRINTLIDLIPQLNIDPEILSSEVRKTYEDVLARHAAAER
jgi:hypothetical protein